MHHNPMDGAQDSQQKTPDPMCFALPPFAPGHDHFVVSVTALEDVGKRQSIQATVPLQSP